MQRTCRKKVNNASGFHFHRNFAFACTPTLVLIVITSFEPTIRPHNLKMFKQATGTMAAGIRWINSDLIGFTYKRKIQKKTPTQRRIIFLKVYYISAGQTSLLQVQWKFYIWTCFHAVAYFVIREITTTTTANNKILYFTP